MPPGLGAEPDGVEPELSLVVLSHGQRGLPRQMGVNGQRNQKDRRGHGCGEGQGRLRIMDLGLGIGA